MNKNLIVLIIIILSQLKKDHGFFLIEKEITNLKKSDFIKNSKNYKRSFLNKILGTFIFVSDGAKKNKINQKFNFKQIKFTSILQILPYHEVKKNVEKFDFNGVNLLFFGC